MTEMATGRLDPKVMVVASILVGLERGIASRWTIAIGLLFASGIMGVAAGFASLKGFSLANLTRDPAAVLGGAAYIGFVSNIGIALWISAAAAALTGGYLALRLRLPPSTYRLLLASGALSLLLGLDDLFMLHEDIFPRLGVPQHFILAAYATVALLYTCCFFRTIRTGNAALFVLSWSFFAGSLAIDQVLAHSEPQAAIEDGAKFFGIALWFLFVVSEIVGRVASAADHTADGTRPA